MLGKCNFFATSVAIRQRRSAGIQSFAKTPGESSSFVARVRLLSARYQQVSALTKELVVKKVVLLRSL